LRVSFIGGAVQQALDDVLPDAQQFVFIANHMIIMPVSRNA
jgi:hypothetical protein